MSFSHIYNQKADIIECRVNGDITLPVLKEIFTTHARMTADTGCTRILNDYREASVQLTTIEIYELPQMIAKIAASFGKDARQVRRALVVSKNSEDYHFYETVAVNNLQKEKLFLDLEEAKLWLMSLPSGRS